MFSSKEKKKIHRLEETIQNQNNTIDKLNRSIIETTESSERIRQVNSRLSKENQELVDLVARKDAQREADVRSIINTLTPLMDILGIDPDLLLNHAFGENKMWANRSMAIMADYLKNSGPVNLDGVTPASSIINTELSAVYKELSEGMRGDLPGDEKNSLRQLGFIVMTLNSMVKKSVIENRRQQMAG